MSTQIRIERLAENNFADFTSLTNCGNHAGCYCAFWHQKWTNMADSQRQQKEAPEINRNIVFEKMRAGFHVGVLAYKEAQLLAWISVGPLTDFYWTWKRVAQVGPAAKDIAGIVCITVAPEFRGKGLQAALLQALVEHGRAQGWTAIEGYPFDASAVEKHQDEVLWPGLTKGYETAGFNRTEAHWLSNPSAERSIFRRTLV